jgi:prepilin-type processing-associated H-X9-DG protein
MGGVHSVHNRGRRQGHCRRLGSPGAGNLHAGKYRELTLSRQRGESGGNATLLPTGTIEQAWWHSDWGYTLRQPGSVQPPASRDITPAFRASGFTLNGWLFDLGTASSSHPDVRPRFFIHESQIRPVATPILGDGIVTMSRPKASDGGSWDLVYGGPSIALGAPDGVGPMGAWVIPRHGSRPRPVPRDWPVSQPLPGAVNMGFFDGHVGQVPLDRLWQLYWHKDYVAPAKRPGLE